MFFFEYVCQILSLGDKWKAEDAIAKLNEKYGRQVLISFFIGTDDRDSNSHIIHVSEHLQALFVFLFFLKSLLKNYLFTLFSLFFLMKVLFFPLFLFYLNISVFIFGFLFYSTLAALTFSKTLFV